MLESSGHTSEIESAKIGVDECKSALEQVEQIRQTLIHIRDRYQEVLDGLTNE